MTRPLRELAALVLLGANALLLLAGLINLAYPAEGTTFSDRAGSAFFNVAGITAVLLPLLAVLLATHVQPPVRQAKLIVQVALIEFAVSALFAVLTFLAWLAGSMVDEGARNAITGLFSRLATGAVFAVAAYLVFRVWRSLYYTPKPKPQPGLYGQPQQPQQGRPGNPGGQPFTPGSYGQPPAPGAGHQPGGFGQPASTPSFAPGQAPAAPSTPGSVFGSGGSSSDVTQVAGPYSVPPQPKPTPVPPSPVYPPSSDTPSSAPVSATPTPHPSSAPSASGTSGSSSTPSPMSLAPTFPDFPKISTSAPAPSTTPPVTPPHAAVPTTPSATGAEPGAEPAVGAGSGPRAESTSSPAVSGTGSTSSPVGSDSAEPTQPVPPPGEAAATGERSPSGDAEPTQPIPPSGDAKSVDGRKKTRSKAAGDGTSATTAKGPGTTEPTQVIPRPTGDPDGAERTQVINPPGGRS